MVAIEKILYLSSDRQIDSNSQIRYKNILKLYPKSKIFYTSHNLKRIDPRRYKANRNIDLKIYKKINEEFISIFVEFKPDILWLDKNLSITFETLSYLKSKFKFFLLSFTNDNPFSNRVSEKNLWKEYLKNLKICDIVFIAQKNQIDNYKKFNCKKIVRYVHGVDYDYINYNNINNCEDKIRFIGNCEEDRIYLIKKIFKNISNFEVCGPNWLRYYQNYSLIFNSKIKKPIWDRKLYFKTIQQSRACLNLLSKSNNDEMASRIFEITSCGGLAISEKNNQLTKIFSEDEIIYYQGFDELISKLNYINKNPNSFNEFRVKSYNKIKSLRLDYNYTIPRWINYLESQEKIIDEVDSLKI